MNTSPALVALTMTVGRLITLIYHCFFATDLETHATYKWPVYTTLALSAVTDLSISMTVTCVLIRFGHVANRYACRQGTERPRILSCPASAQPLLRKLKIYAVSAGVLPRYLM